MKFSGDFDKYAEEVNPFRKFYHTQSPSVFKTNTDESRKIYEETKVNREEWIKLRDRYVAERILRELGYEVLLTSSYFEYYPDAIPCEGASGQCTIDCRMNGCKYE